MHQYFKQRSFFLLVRRRICGKEKQAARRRKYTWCFLFFLGVFLSVCICTSQTETFCFIGRFPTAVVSNNGFYLGGSEGHDMLHIPPCETGPHLEHEGHHSCRQGGCGRRTGVALRAAGPLVQRPIRCHLQNDKSRYVYNIIPSKYLADLGMKCYKMMTLVKSLKRLVRKVAPTSLHHQQQVVRVQWCLCGADCGVEA